MSQANAAQDAAARPPNGDATTPTKPSPEDVPERPRRAPGVETSGQMQETGFEEQQWLVQKDGRFIQLTELLYRVVEAIDGQKSLDQIAATVSKAVGRKVSADNVRQLIASKLIPIGLVLTADGSVAAPAGGSTPRSPLQVNMRMARIDGRYIEPAARALQFLFLPPILIPVLIVAAVAHAWLFLVHGIAASIHQTLHTPGLLLAVLGLLILGTVFHEFGHAAALTYSGGKVRGMGAGLYLIYPAFYTDVTDAYRLGRWARVRTDLGGFYFNLIFSLGMMGLYLLTGQEFLLLVVLLITLDIIHQLLPFVRLDGYWTFADLTGMPDLFSQVGPFLRSVLPIPGWKGRKLAKLKGWVKLAFGAYILITVPLLLGLLFLMIRGVPRVLATAWESARQQMSTIQAAWPAGDVLQVAASAVQIILLAIPSLGVVYLLFNLGRRVFTGLWRWSQPSLARRALATSASLAIVGLIVFLWMPRIPTIDPLTGEETMVRAQFRPIQPDERGTLLSAARGVRSGAVAITSPQPPGDAPPPAPTAEPAPSDQAPTGAPAGTPAPTPTPATRSQPTPTPDARTTPAPVPTRAPVPTVEPTPAPTQAPAPTAVPTPTAEPTPEPTLTPAGTPETR